MENEDRQRGITAVKAGKFELTQKILAGVVQSAPDSEEGWLWLGHSMSDPKKRFYCYQKALALNPQNESARQGIEALDASNQPGLQETGGGEPNPPAAPAPSPSGAGIKSKSENSLGTWLSIIIPVLFVFLCVIPLLYLGMTGQLQALADRYIPSRPQQPLQPAASVIATASLTPSSIPATATASSTPTASPNPTETTTPKPSFKPGDPTATPLGSDITNPDFVAGLKAYHANDYQEAIRRMDAAILANPYLAPAYHYRGKA
jgi:tetratricopeptide (TPR) repeat protein